MASALTSRRRLARRIAGQRAARRRRRRSRRSARDASRRASALDYAHAEGQRWLGAAHGGAARRSLRDAPGRAPRRRRDRRRARGSPSSTAMLGRRHPYVGDVAELRRHPRRRRTGSSIGAAVSLDGCRHGAEQRRTRACRGLGQRFASVPIRNSATLWRQHRERLADRRLDAGADRVARRRRAAPAAKATRSVPLEAFYPGVSRKRRCGLASSSRRSRCRSAASRVSR